MRWLQLAALVPGIAAAQSATPSAPAAADDGYCDYVEGTASAAAATLSAPELFGQFGFIEQPSFAVAPDADTSNLRLLGGVRYSLSNIVAASATRARASADCRRHKATTSVQGATDREALTARLRVLEDSMKQAETILATATADLEARRLTAPEALATRMRVEDLRSQAATTRRELAALPATEGNLPARALLDQYRAADADVERAEARLRTIRAYDVSVRAGVDRFLDGPNDDTRYFAVLQVGFNLGRLFQGSGNARSAAGRKRFVQTTQDAQLNQSAVAAQLQGTLEADTQRITEVTALVTDLGRQIEALTKLDTEDSKRFRDTMWFEWVKAKAELAFLTTRVEALRGLLEATRR